MSEFKMSTFLVGLVFVSAVAAILGLLMSHLSTDYGITYEDNESPAILNKMDSLKSNITKYKHDTIDTSKDKTIVPDILGKIFEGGHLAIKSVVGSIDIFQAMLESGINQANLGETSSIIRIAILTSILAIIVVGILISVVVRMRV